MSVLFIALPLAILLGAAGLFACLHCIGSGQYEDLDNESYRILVDQQPEEQIAQKNSDSPGTV
jgi:cbb3-type cytochrome oxidase maturation protein